MTTSRKRGVAAKPIFLHPIANFTFIQEPASFCDALSGQMARHDDSPGHLQKALACVGVTTDYKVLKTWMTGEKSPSTTRSFAVLAAIEERYQLPPRYFLSKITAQPRARSGINPAGITTSERRRLAWHLPHDFDERSRDEQNEIIAWIRKTIVSGATDFRLFQSAATKEPFALALVPGRGRNPDAPTSLMAEMADLLKFKTSVLSTPGLKRNGRWVAATAAQKIEHLGLLFGALAADPDGPTAGAGLPTEHLSFAMLALPAVWDWYVGWRQARRGFFTDWEVDMLNLAKAFVRAETGWLRHRPELAGRLVDVPGLIDRTDIVHAQTDWHSFCDAMHDHAAIRINEIKSQRQVHRNPFEPILPILDTESPLAEYKKIADEIERETPSAKHHPKPNAECQRSLLMIRFGLHTGFRQKNLRQLMVCLPGQLPRSERALAQLQRGELRWRPEQGAWEIFVPVTAFKNSGSTYFSSSPFKMLLPNIAGLYTLIDGYVASARRILLAGAVDPGTLFVKSVSKRSSSAEYDDQSFYVAWRQIICRYGIYNPYTGRGAIAGLLPHGPHNIRDVLATEVLKRTGSFEQASYAIQDTPAVVQKHYGRFLPKDKAAMAAEILNKVWAA